MDDLIFVSISKEDGSIFISEESTSGAEYKYTGSKDEIKAAVADYIDKYYISE